MPRIDLEVANAVPRAADYIHDKGVDLVRRTIIGIEAGMRAGAPIGETGGLAGNISSDIKTSNSGAEGEARAGQEYAAYVNYGTGSRGAASNVPLRGSDIRYSPGWKGMAARPFASRAAEQGKREWDAGWRNLERGMPHV